MPKVLQAVRGMNDILPEEAEVWEDLEERLVFWLKSYGYRPLRLPVVEPTSLFRRAIGESTDIVEKEMYAFTDNLNGEELTLRPEGTAGCVRAAIQHNMAAQVPKRLYYSGPMFRHERPQKGRYRQFNQFGVESLGFSGPDIDAEHILMLARLWDELGISDLVSLQLNNLGEVEERTCYREALVTWLAARQERLDEDSRRRLHSNPLRILDSKNPETQKLCRQAPQLVDYLGEKSRHHLKSVERFLRDAGVEYTVNPNLVRGLDYYNLTVYEWVTNSLGAQGTICAGGRYDGLFAQLGGKPTPAAGFAIGQERLLGVLANAGKLPEATTPNVYMAHQGEAAQRLAFSTAELLRDESLRVIVHCGGGGFKAQIKKADQSGADFAVIIGGDEVTDNTAQLKPLREMSGLEGSSYSSRQQCIPVARLADAIYDYYIGQSDDSD